MIDCNIDAEKSVLGAIFVDNDVFSDININSDDFSDGATKSLFNTMVALYNAGKPIDQIGVINSLHAQGRLDSVGGVLFVTDVARYIPTSANIMYHCEILKELTLRRKLKQYAKELNFKAGDYEDVSVLADEAQKELLKIFDRDTDKGAIPVRIAAEKYTQLMIERDGNPNYGVMSKYMDLDNITGGFKRGNLIVLAARPAMGKTAFALNIAQNVARTLPVLFVSLEMSEEQLVDRLFKGEAGALGITEMGTGATLERNMNMLKRSLNNLKLHIYDNSVVSVGDIRRVGRKLKHQLGELGLIVVDYIQLMKGEKKNDSRVQEVSELTRSLKILARDLEVPVIALSQLSRAVELRQDKRPMLSDLRESGSIEQDADIVMMLYRESYYDKESTNPNYTELIINKHRAGPVGTVHLFYKFEELRFRGLEKRIEPITYKELENAQNDDDEFD